MRMSHYRFELGLFKVSKRHNWVVFLVRRWPCEQSVVLWLHDMAIWSNSGTEVQVINFNYSVEMLIPEVLKHM